LGCCSHGIDQTKRKIASVGDAHIVTDDGTAVADQTTVRKQKMHSKEQENDSSHLRIQRKQNFGKKYTKVRSSH
jgi:hypothetical protein